MVLVEAVAVFLGGLSAFAGPGEAPDTACPTNWLEAASACGWELVTLEKPFVVRIAKGTLVNEGGGEWPEGVDVAIELARASRSERRRVGHAQIPSGAFKLDGLEPGEYCFRIGVRPLGWSCVEGRIIVSKQAPPGARVVVTVPLGR